ncbi:U1 small nuclear ribonucleoprotein c [Oopsacas minuta]|uniref:U1 small nuclear ribonucleoprotein C n=1 Tax=Oopsacas minuta TaxID=111878 RepID=A0AAV7JQM7_9METZ|nr:U1 small nuclear ribonucleoprotein c [Oopsacas minuta]
MPKYYCDYCDTYLTHDSPSVRKTHNGGRKHKEAVRLYYTKWIEEQAQSFIDQTYKAQMGNAMPPFFMGGGVPVRGMGMPPGQMSMVPPPVMMGGPVGPPGGMLPPGSGGPMGPNGPAFQGDPGPPQFTGGTMSMPGPHERGNMPGSRPYGRMYRGDSKD